MTRIAIAGHPRSGKSTLAYDLPGPVHLTDELLYLNNWDNIVTTVSYWFDQPGPWTVCGVVVPHALRVWRRRHPGSDPPLEHFAFIRRSTFLGLTERQTWMAHGIETVTRDLAGWLYPVFTTERELRERYVSTTEQGD